jgi:UDP-N-acetylglucosamine 4-epimerase
MSNNYIQLQTELRSNPKVWLITGVAGFIGSNLLEKLLLLNQKIIGIDNFSTGHFRNLEDVRSRVNNATWSQFNFFKGDITNLEHCRTVTSGVDYVLHQAGLGSVPLSIEDPITANQINVSGSLNMLIAARDAQVKRFVYATSSAVYGNDISLPKVEELVGQPLSPYSVTKYVNEIYANLFTRLYGLECIGLRYFNVFGPRQDPNGPYSAVIPKWFSAFLKKQSVYINGNGLTTRDFCYVDDVAQANILAASTQSKEAIGEVYNIGYGQSTTLNGLFKLIQEQATQFDLSVKQQQPIYQDFRLGDILHSVADIKKARELLGYQPNFSIQEGLNQASYWYFNNSTCINFPSQITSHKSY